MDNIKAVFTNRQELKTLGYVKNVEYYDYPDADIFLNLSLDNKIAVVEINYSDEQETYKELEKFKISKWVIVYSMECTTNILNLIKEFDLPNFIFVINGILNFDFKHAQCRSTTPHISGITHTWNENLLDLLKSKLTPFDKKPYWFEVMYGLPRSHRQFVASWIDKNDLNRYCFQTPFFQKSYNIGANTSDANNSYNLQDNTYWEDEIIPSLNKNYYCKYYNIEMMLSHVMPFKIYQQSAFSLVCETSADNAVSFFTEKIAKPILAYRLFIVISGQYYLKNLRQLGFKTFDGIIDESYDLESDPTKRWTMALEQVKILCSQDQTKILRSIIPIVLHNRDLLFRLPTNTLSLELHRLLLEN